MDTATCRHAQLEAFVGDPCCSVAPCAVAEGDGTLQWPRCDNCARRQEQGAPPPLAVRRSQWVSALQQVWRCAAVERRRKRGLTAGAPTLRHVAHAWYQAKDPDLPPVWARLPLLCHALIRGTFGVDFVQLRLPLEWADGLASEERTRWVALMTLNANGLRVAANDPALACIRLQQEAFDSLSCRPGVTANIEEAKLAQGDNEAPVLRLETDDGGALLGCTEDSEAEDAEWEPLAFEDAFLFF